jgi:hypothetical protein
MLNRGKAHPEVGADGRMYRGRVTGYRMNCHVRGLCPLYAGNAANGHLVTVLKLRAVFRRRMRCPGFPPPGAYRLAAGGRLSRYAVSGSPRA